MIDLRMKELLKNDTIFHYDLKGMFKIDVYYQECLLYVGQQGGYLKDEAFDLLFSWRKERMIGI